MAGGCCVKHNVVVVLVVVRQQGREFIERRDLGGACARQLLAHGGALGIGGTATHLAQHAQAVRLGSLVGVDVEHRQSWHMRHRGGGVFKLHTQHFIQIGGCIGADQQHALACVGQVNCHGYGQRCFAHPALAGEEQVAGGVRQQIHDVSFGLHADFISK